MEKNPFTLKFGQKPLQYISRITQTREIIEDFQSEQCASSVYIITGVRGSGKTVLMTNILQNMSQEEDWIVLELNPNRDLLQGLASKLYDEPHMQKLFIQAKLNLNAFGIGVSSEIVSPISNIETAIERMLEQVKKCGKKVLIAIDEVTNSENMRVFASAYQIFLRQDMPLYLLMTGLYDNIYNLQNDKTMTFLYRTPKILLEPLNFTAIRDQYKMVFNNSIEEATYMAGLTRGFSFAFQVLGYLYFENKGKLNLEQLMPQYDQFLAEYVYEKIWSEMSEIDKKIAYEISQEKNASIKDLRLKLDNMSSEKFSVYRDRLKRKGILNTSTYGKLSLALPRFEEFIMSKMVD